MEENQYYCIKKTNILLVEIKKFTHLVGNTIAEECLSDEEKYRKVLFYDHMFMDFATGDLLEEIYDRDGNIKRPIKANTMYVETTYAYPNPTDQDLIEAANLYERTLKRKCQLKEKKLISFPQRTIY